MPFLPREGLTLEAMYAPFRLTALNPFFTGPILLAILKYPEEAEKARNFFGPLVREFLEKYEPTPKVIKFLFAWGALRVFNNWLSRKSVNNWRTDSYQWDREIVLVTGGNSGIGNLVARDLAGRGITTIVLDLQPPKEPLPRNAYYYKLDVTSAKMIHEVATEIRGRHGEPTIILNNAGIGVGEEILSEDEKKIDLTLGVNLKSHFLMAKEFLPALIKKNHGHIITIASMASFATNAQNADYAATKAGVLAFHEGLTSELSERYGAPKVRTSIFHPIWVKTPLIHDLASSPNFKDFILEPETVSDSIVKQILSGEGGQVFLPARYAATPLIRALPQWVGHGIRKHIAGTLKGMIDDGSGKGRFDLQSFEKKTAGAS